MRMLFVDQVTGRMLNSWYHRTAEPQHYEAMRKLLDLRLVEHALQGDSDDERQIWLNAAFRSCLKSSMLAS